MSRSIWLASVVFASLAMAFAAAAQDLATVTAPAGAQSVAPPAASAPGPISLRSTTDAGGDLPRNDDVSYGPRRGCGPTFDGERATADGKTHGDVAVAVGTDGYRVAGARVCAPLGSDGEVEVRVSRTEGGYGGGYRGRRN